ncbi:MAG: hypothetical protein GY796_06895 [Chloroflexi bacterium]|nr:hypothetical protein [Chloroflexota bacterium]
MSFLKHIWEDIKRGENIDLYVVIPIAISLAILNIIGFVSSRFIEPITLIILGLIAISLLVNRNTVRMLSNEISLQVNSVFYRKFPSTFESDIREAKEIWLIGITLTDFIRGNQSILKEKLHKGHIIKALVVHPDSPAIEMAETKNANRAEINVERARGEVRHSLEDLVGLRKIAPKNLEVRTIQHLPSYAAFGVNLETPSGTLYISHFAFKIKAGSEPKLVLQVTDGHWYDFYKREIHNMWDQGISWQHKKDFSPIERDK